MQRPSCLLFYCLWPISIPSDRFSVKPTGKREKWRRRLRSSDEFGQIHLEFNDSHVCFLSSFFRIFRWFRHITDATEAYKSREGRNRRPDGTGSGSPSMGSIAPCLSASSSSSQLLPTPSSAAEQSDKSKE